MESVNRSHVPALQLRGRRVQRLVGRDAAIGSERMTVGTARYSDDTGPMAPHRHAEETIVVLEANDARVRFGLQPDDHEGAYPPGFRIQLHLKDLRNALDLARDAEVALPAAASVEQLMRAAAAAGRGDYDHSGLLTVLEDLARFRVADGAAPSAG